MGSLQETGKDEQVIYVGVGKNVNKSKTTLFWVVQNFMGKKICLLHVHQPKNLIDFDSMFAASKANQLAVEASQEAELQKMHDTLEEYLKFLGETGVQADKVWIERSNIEKGIVESISCYNIRWLVLGAAADKYNSKCMVGIKSRKALFVCHNAPEFSHIWFTCNGCLIYTREGRTDECESKMLSPLTLLSVGSRESECIKLYCQRQRDPDSAMVTQLRSAEDSCKMYIEKPLPSPRSDGGRELLEGPEHDSGYIFRRFPSHFTENPCSTSTFTHKEEQRIKGKTVDDIYSKIEQAVIDAKNCRRQAFEEAVKRWKEEDHATDAKNKAKASEDLYIKEMNKRKKLEESLAGKRQEMDKVKNQLLEVAREHNTVQAQNLALKTRVSDANYSMKELEEKIISAVELLISFKERRDRLQIEHQDILREVRKLRKSVKVESPIYCGPQILSFSFADIIEATHDFHSSWRIGDGKYGTVYKGILQYMRVAIKMLPSFGQGTLDFFHEVEVLSRVRHPNLVTLVGMCPESHSLVYEFLENGSLEDRLACKDKTAPLSWLTRISIAADICSALVFLHSHKPPIIHGNLKSSNILLDTNFVSKIGDLGIHHFVPMSDNTETNNEERNFGHNSDFDGIECSSSGNGHNSDFDGIECSPSGKFSRESDVYSFGLILLELLTGGPISLKNVKCAVEKENFETLLDVSAGDWSVDEATQLAQLALRCCEGNELDQPDLVSEIHPVLQAIRDWSIASDSSSSKRMHQRQPPSYFLCPIFQEVMQDPLIAADGFTYEADAIRGWLKNHNTSPMTNLKLENSNLVPNHTLLYAIQEWKQLL